MIEAKALRKENVDVQRILRVHIPQAPMIQEIKKVKKEWGSDVADVVVKKEQT